MKEIEGRTYGPADVRTCLERVADLVTATGDDPERWRFFAPPSFASAMLFAVAPLLFSDSEVAPHTRSLLHGEQTFRWPAALPLEHDLHVTGRVDRVRSRGEVWFVSFSGRASGLDGREMLEASATFLMSGTAPPVAEAAEEPEPAPDEKGPDECPRPVEGLGPGDQLPPLAKSASRADLVRYGAATRDWNPLHWDHATARGAGLPRVVCHGLLMGAWVIQAAARVSARPDPLEEVRLRFREPLPAAEAARVEGRIEEALPGGRLRLRLAVSAGETERAAASAVVRT